MPKEKGNIPKVSVIIPNFNNSRYIEEAIRSVLDQTLQDIEVIVIDDCSTDDSWEILQRIAQTDDRIKIIRNSEKSGAGISRNLGLHEARGEFIKFLDSDDTLPVDALKLMYDAARENNSKIVCGYMQRVDRNGNIKPHNAYFYKRSFQLNNTIITPETSGAESSFKIVAIGDALYAKELFGDHLGFPNIKWEDLATIPIIKYGVGEMFYIDKAVYNYRSHEKSTTRTDKERKIPNVHDIIKCCDILRDEMPEKYQYKIDEIEFESVILRINDIVSWKDCSEEHKKIIISAIYQIAKKDIPDYKNICNFPLAQEMYQIQNQRTIEPVSNLIEKIRQFDKEEICLSTHYSRYEQIHRAYSNFIKNIGLLYNSPNDTVFNSNEGNQKKNSLSRKIIEDRVIQDLMSFYDNIHDSNDYSDEQKQNVLKDMYNVTFELISNALEHLLITNANKNYRILSISHPELQSYLIPEFENMSKDECMTAIDDVVHSSEFQKYPMRRMAEHCLRHTTLYLVDKFTQLSLRFRDKLRGLNE